MVFAQVFGSQESVHHDAESGAVMGDIHPHDLEPSSTTDDPTVGESEQEVKVMLLPHTCLHFHPSAGSPDAVAGSRVVPATDTACCRHSECHMEGDGERHTRVEGQACAQFKNKRRSASSLSSHDSETQALIDVAQNDARARATDVKEEEGKEKAINKKDSKVRQSWHSIQSKEEEEEEKGLVDNEESSNPEFVRLVVRLPTNGEDHC